MGGTPRPLVELCWRADLAAASLEEDPAGHWAMTNGYWRLDPSEKRAISYFLGMTQARIMCGRLLRAPHLIHLDAFLTMIGQTTRASRPDLVAALLEAPQDQIRDDDAITITQLPGIDLDGYTGLDGVFINPGPSWPRRPQ